YQPALGRYVAIKVLPPQTSGDPSFRERFAVEARAIGKLRHPNIVTAYDFSQQGDVAFLVSDFIDGGTLADQLGAPLPLEYALTAHMAHVHKPVPVPTSIGVPLPPAVESALVRALAKKPEERFARVSDFVRALASPASTMVPSAGPVSAAPVIATAAESSKPS